MATGNKKGRGPKEWLRPERIAEARKMAAVNKKG